MDCDRFEATLIDELYEELDELTSAAAKRHVAGCSRCASLIGGLRATRRVAVLTVVEPSLDLEDRILAAARNAQKIVPIGRRLSRAVSWAGSWAMRPQTAMAAVFLLMVGSSLLFVRRSKVAAVDSAMKVTAQGEPAPAGQAFPSADETTSLDSKLAAAAHGAGPSSPPANAGFAAPVPTSAASSGPGYEGALALKDKERSLPATPLDAFGTSGEVKNAEAPAGAPRPPPARAAWKGAGSDDAIPSDLDKAQGGAGGGAPAQHAQQGQGSSDLQAAHNVRDTSGCGVAVSTFDRIAQQSRGTSTGDQATYDAAECYRALGQTDLALARYRSLLTVQQFQDLATQGIARIPQSQNQYAGKAASRKPSPAKANTDTVAQPTQAPPATSPAAPPPQQSAAPAGQVPAQQQRGL